MKRLVLAALVAASMIAAPGGGKSDPPAVVTINGDDTITVTTTATSRYCDPANSKFIGYGGCNVRIVADGGTLVFTPQEYNRAVIGSVSNWAHLCPCTAQFWEHAGQWHSYSALSDQFTP